MHLDSEYIYGHLPIAAQNMVCWAYGVLESRTRLGQRFQKKLDWLLQTEWWSHAQIDAYQNEQLQKLIEYAYQRVPYYRELMKRLGLTPADIRTRADLPKLPVLTKEEVRANFKTLLAENVAARDIIFKHTSGTTGKALHFYVSRRSVPFQWAVWWRHRHRFGIDKNAWHANFTGKRVVPPAQKEPPFWRWNAPMRQILLNMHHVTPEKVGAIVDFLNTQPIEFFSGYPSIIHAFVTIARDAGCRLTHPPRFVFTGAENMLDDQRRDIQAYTGAVLTDQYGFSEGCGNASHCEKLAYHEDFEFGILECVDPEPPDEQGRVRGKIVATGFGTREFPFIRYEIGDVGVWEPETKICACGRKSRVLSHIEGRIDDYVITPEGRKLMRFDYAFKDTMNAKEIQVVQYRLGEISLRIVRRPEFSSKDEEDIRRELIKWISPTLKVQFEYVNEIEREKNGKFRAVKSYLKKT